MLNGHKPMVSRCEIGLRVALRHYANKLSFQALVLELVRVRWDNLVDVVIGDMMLDVLAGLFQGRHRELFQLSRVTLY